MSNPSSEKSIRDWSAATAGLTGAASTLRNGLRVIRLDDRGTSVGLRLRFERSVDSVRAASPCIVGFDPVRSAATVPPLHLSFDGFGSDDGRDAHPKPDDGTSSTKGATLHESGGLGETIVQYTARGFRIFDRIVPWYVAVLAIDTSTGRLHGLEPGQVDVAHWGQGVGRRLRMRRAMAIVPVDRLSAQQRVELRLIQLPQFDPAVVFAARPAGEDDRRTMPRPVDPSGSACRRIG